MKQKDEMKAENKNTPFKKYVLNFLPPLYGREQMKQKTSLSSIGVLRATRVFCPLGWLWVGYGLVMSWVMRIFLSLDWSGLIIIIKVLKISLSFLFNTFIIAIELFLAMKTLVPLERT